MFSGARSLGTCNQNSRIYPEQNTKVKRMNTGQKTLEWLYREQLKVDEQWSVQAPNAFTWWADKNAQKVELIGTQVDPLGETAYLIGVQTDFLRKLAPTDKTLTAINSILMTG